MLLYNSLDYILLPNKIGEFHQEVCLDLEELITKITFQTLIECVEEEFEGFEVKSDVKFGSQLFLLCHNLCCLVGIFKFTESIQNMEYLLMSAEMSINLLSEKHIIAIW